MCGKFLKKIVPIALAVAGVVTGNVALIGAGVSAFGANQQAKQADKAFKQQEQANQQATANSKAALTAQEQATNRANAKQPNVAALLAQNKNDTTLGATQLTGVGGVKRSELQLGKNTLLGQ